MSLTSTDIWRSPRAGIRTSNLSPSLRPLIRSSRRSKPQPDVVHVDEGEQRNAGRHHLALLDIDLIDLRRGGRGHHHLVDERLQGIYRRRGAQDLGLRHMDFLRREARDRLLIGELRLVVAALGDPQAGGCLVQMLLRSRIGRRPACANGHRSAVARATSAAVRSISALRTATVSARVPAWMRASSASATPFAATASASLATSSGLSIWSRTVPACDVLPPLHRDLGDPAVDPRGDVDPRAVGLALNHQRHRPGEIPGGEADDHRDDNRQRDRRRRSFVPRACHIGYGPWRKLRCRVGDTMAGPRRAVSGPARTNSLRRRPIWVLGPSTLP